MPPDPAPAGRQQRQGERQEQPQTGARHGPGERGWWHQGQGFWRAAPTASRAGGAQDLAPAGGRRRKAGAWGRRLDPGRRRPRGGATRARAPGSPAPPRPAARGQRLKINSGKCIPRLWEEEREAKGGGGSTSATRLPTWPHRRRLGSRAGSRSDSLARTLLRASLGRSAGLHRLLPLT